jgi:polygalacturonase
MKDSPFWFNHIYDCDHVHFKNVHIVAPEGSPNTDGWDPDSSRNVLIEDSTYRGGDDCVAIKSGWDCFGIDYGKPSVNITIRNVTCESRNAGGIAIGSEISGGVENVMVSNVTIRNHVKRALLVKAGKSRGGYVRNVTFRDILITGNVRREGISVDLFLYSNNASDNPSCPTDWMPRSLSKISGLRFKNIDGSNAAFQGDATFRFESSEESPIEDIYLQNIHFQQPDHGVGWVCSAVHGQVFHRTVTPWPPCDGFSVIRGKLSGDDYSDSLYTKSHGQGRIVVCPRYSLLVVLLIFVFIVLFTRILSMKKS